MKEEKNKKEEKLSYRQLERIVRGFSNHRRIEMLELLKKEPELSVIDVTRKLGINFKTASEHIRRLAITGLVMKRSEYTSVRHKLTARGEAILKFLRTLE
ncbi:MAG: winged helix-turn-helix transcriptional regulator [Nanoarchaeota archaeon]|nr:winged helix-turn-helix transcriptional regulator [Nanoarchaeota archaeon]